MQKTRIFFKLISPSIVSVTASIFMAILLLIVVNGSFFSETNFVYRAILGSEASPTLVESLGAQFEAIGQIFANDQLGTITVFLFWMFVGICVYGIFTYAGNVFGELSDDVQALKTGKDKKHRFGPFTITLEHFVFRITLIILGIIYTIGLYYYIFPATFASFAAGAVDGFSFSGFGYTVSSIALTAICLHAYIIMGRLFTLRYRLVSQ